MNKRLLARVQKGATLLDEKFPGWEGKISLYWLDITSYVNDVLGQCFGNYDAGLERLYLSEMEAVRLGFTTSSKDEYICRGLSAAWKYVIKQRYATS